MKPLCMLSLLLGCSCTTASPPPAPGTPAVQAFPVRIVAAQGSAASTRSESSREYDAGLRRAAATYRAARDWLDALGVAHATPDEPLDICLHDSTEELQRAAAANGVIIGPHDLAFFVRRGRGTTHVLRSTLTGDSLLDRVLLQHEIAHHTLMAVGLHREGVTWPAWLTEGIATQFEDQLPIAQRRGDLPVNSFRRDDFLTALRTGSLLPIAKLVSQEDGFDPRGPRANIAYAQAWATVAFLSARQRERFGRYVTDVGRRPANRPITADEELAEFERQFGRADDTLQQEMVRYVESNAPSDVSQTRMMPPTPTTRHAKER